MTGPLDSPDKTATSTSTSPSAPLAEMASSLTAMAGERKSSLREPLVGTGATLDSKSTMLRPSNLGSSRGEFSEEWKQLAAARKVMAATAIAFPS